MLRKTRIAPAQHPAAPAASMRPQRNAAENVTRSANSFPVLGGFNEAAA